MSDQAKQIPSQFNGQKDRFAVNLRIQELENQKHLKISLVDRFSKDLFEKNIDQNYIDDQVQMINLIQDAEHLLYIIQQNFSQISVTDDGVIKFDLKVGLKQKKITIQIPTEKKEKPNKIEFFISQTQKLKAEFEQKIIQNQKNMQRIKAENDLKIQMLQKQNQDLNNLIERNQAAHKIQMIQMKALLNATNEATTKELLEQIKKERLTFRQRHKTLEQQLSLNPAHLGHSGNNQLAITKIERGFRIKHIAESSYSNFIANFSIPLRKTTEFDIKVITLTNKILALGFGTKKMFGSSSRQHKQFINLFLRDNSVNFNGVLQFVHQNKVNNGDVIKMSINRRIGNRITWSINGAKLVEVSIPESMKSQKLYFILWSVHHNDEFEVFPLSNDHQ